MRAQLQVPVLWTAWLVLLVLALGSAASAAEVLVGGNPQQELPLTPLALTGLGGAGGLLAGAPLQCLEVTGPVLSACGLVDGGDVLGNPARLGAEEEAGGREACVVTLMEHVFGNSYGKPFVANYVPPSASSCSLASTFNRVVVNFTVVSEGRQFDRLAIMWLNDTEVWRTSTAEPKIHPGISWTYGKDMTNYIALWKQPQTLIFDLGNLINDKYTGSFNATLTATYFHEDMSETSPLAVPADQILPISAGKGKSGIGSAWIYPDVQAVASVSLPRNVKRAVVSIAATGQADEEFWWSNVPEASKDMFNGTTLPGKGSFREVRLYIDGEVAGLSWPFPVVFTGGVSPPLHRPIVGPQAFNLREQEIDITPWLGLLCDGKPHSFSMQVFGADDAVVNRYWVLSGKIFVWLLGDGEAAGRVTTGPRPSVSLSRPNYQPGDTSVRGKHVRYDQTIQRRLDVRSSITTGSGKLDAAWTQTFSMRNQGTVLDAGDFQNVSAWYKGRDVAMQNGTGVFDARYSYPILSSLLQTAVGNRSLTLEANLTQSMDLTLMGKAVFSNGLEAFLPLLKDKDGPNGNGNGNSNVAGARVSTTKSGTGLFWQKDGGKRSGGFGSTRQHYALLGLRYADISDSWEPDGEPSPTQSSMTQGPGRPLYWRDVSVVNETTTHDARWAYGLDVVLAAATQPVGPEPVAGNALDGRYNTFAAKFWGGKPGRLGMMRV
ncbi:hypothetical protein E4U55_004250 [Claviceps digitariae]|nr:hypothetical protein E4U55_004250 [Claviceps digitariae]